MDKQISQFIMLIGLCIIVFCTGYLSGRSNPDLNGDGVVDKYDFSILMNNWSKVK